ncbi:MAG: hypothetical protein GY719_41785 [bacterium]|nr:hypothetical protein [bacterium]
MTALRVDLALNLEAGFSQYLEEIAGGYGDFVTPLLEEGESLPDIRFQLEILRRGVARGRRRLQDFSPGIIDQTHEDAKVSGGVAERMKALEGKLRQVRHICRGIYGTEGVERVGLKDEPPRAAIRLWEHGLTVKTSLLKPDLGLEPLIEIEVGEGVATPVAQLAARLEPELAELGDLVEDRHRENRKSDEIRSRQRQVIRQFDLDVRAIVRTAQGLLRLAGRNDLAERFRPLLRRVTRRIAKADGEPAADQTVDAPEKVEVSPNQLQ